MGDDKTFCEFYAEKEVAEQEISKIINKLSQDYHLKLYLDLQTIAGSYCAKISAIIK